MSNVTLKDILDLLEEAGIESDVNELNPSEPLLEQGLDSLDMMNVYFQIEEKYGISIGEEDISSGEWDSLEKIASGISKN